MNNKKIAVLLSGAGVYDGSEIQESVLALYFIAKLNMQAVCFAPNRNQHHVINHLDGSEQNETRNILVESARIARGQVEALEQANIDHLDALVIPGGFGSAKNLNQWALQGADGKIFDDAKNFILQFINNKKPIVALCMGPTVVAKALQDSTISATLSVGSTQAPSPYDIADIHKGMTTIGAKTKAATIQEIVIDKENKIISAPCYMMEANLSQMGENIRMALEALQKFW